MRDLILNLLERDHVSFAEINREIPGSTGDVAMVVRDNDQLILWPYLSEECFNVLDDLETLGEMYSQPCSVLPYWIDGVLPSFPVARRPNYCYKRPHWFPVTLRPGRAK